MRRASLWGARCRHIHGRVESSVYRTESSLIVHVSSCAFQGERLSCSLKIYCLETSRLLVLSQYSRTRVESDYPCSVFIFVVWPRTAGTSSSHAFAQGNDRTGSQFSSASRFPASNIELYISCALSTIPTNSGLVSQRQYRLRSSFNLLRSVLRISYADVRLV